MAHDEELAQRIRDHLGPAPGVTEKRMFGGLAFLVEGHMALAASGRGGLLVRSDPAEAEELVATTAAEPQVMNGRALKAWLSVPAEEVAEDGALARWVGVGLRATVGLPPKPDAGGR